MASLMNTTTTNPETTIAELNNAIEILEIIEKLAQGEDPTPYYETRTWKMGDCVAAAKHIKETYKDINYVPLVFRITQKDYVGGSQRGPTSATVANFKELMPNNNKCPTHCILWNQTNRRIYDPMFELGGPNEEIPIDTYFQELVKKDVIEYDAECKELMFDVEYLSAQGYANNRATYPEHDFPIAVVKVNVETYEVNM